MHCKVKSNGCEGVQNCFCNCEECLLADDHINDDSDDDSEG
jgi:hypothetical protein